MRKKYNLYAVKKDGKHLGVFKASTIAEKIGCSLSSISIAARKGFIIKGRYEVKLVVDTKDQEDAAVGKNNQKNKIFIVGSEETKRTTSAGRTYKLPAWDEYKEED